VQPIDTMATRSLIPCDPMLFSLLGNTILRWRRESTVTVDQRRHYPLRGRAFQK
jgi:hypothetical protein